MMYTLLRLSRLVDRRHALRIPELQFRKRIQFLRQTPGIRRVRVRSAQQIRKTATSKRTLQSEVAAILVDRATW